MTDEQRNAQRYLWWRENIELLQDDSVAGVAYGFQIPLHGLDKSVTAEQSDGELMDAIADRGIASDEAEGRGGFQNA